MQIEGLCPPSQVFSRIKGPSRASPRRPHTPTPSSREVSRARPRTRVSRPFLSRSRSHPRVARRVSPRARDDARRRRRCGPDGASLLARARRRRPERRADDACASFASRGRDHRGRDRGGRAHGDDEEWMRGGGVGRRRAPRLACAFGCCKSATTSSSRDSTIR